MEHHLARFLDALTDIRPRHLVLDAVSACRRMGSDKAAFEFLVRLLTACKDRGVTCFCTNQSSGDDAPTKVSGMEIASLMDALISLEYTPGEQDIRRRLLVIKSRGAAHSMRYHELSISDGGISLKPDEAPPEGRRS